MRTIDLDSLEIFRTVVQEGGVIRAAQKLNRVQSNVTTRIRQLEERLGVRLFHRQGRGLGLSAEGHALLAYAERLLRLADEAVGDLKTGRPRGIFRLGSLESTAGSRLPAILSRYHALYPDVVIELRTGTTGSLLGRLLDYELEAALVSEPFTAPGLNSLPVFDEELVLVTPKGIGRIDRALASRRITLIAFSEGCSYRKRLEDWLGSENILPERILEFASYPAIIACVAAGTGFALVPRSILAGLKSADEIACHELPRPYAANRTHLVWLDEPSPALKALTELLGDSRIDRPAAAKITGTLDSGL